MEHRCEPRASLNRLVFPRIEQKVLWNPEAGDFYREINSAKPLFQRWSTSLWKFSTISQWYSSFARAIILIYLFRSSPNPNQPPFNILWIQFYGFDWSGLGSLVELADKIVPLDQIKRVYGQTDDSIKSLAKAARFWHLRVDETLLLPFRSGGRE